MKKEIIKRIFKRQNIDIDDIKKIDIGFSNKLYSVDDKYILKVCDDNESNFKNENYFYELFKSSLPVPKVICYDNSKESCDKDYMIYHKISGDNLYSKWHLLNDDSRRKIIKQLCDILKVINDCDYREIIKECNISPISSWKDKVYTDIKKSIEKLKKLDMIQADLEKDIIQYLDNNISILDEQKLGFVYWDAHFDNILVKGDEIVGILDFERVHIESIDHVLDLVNRMIVQPTKYVSEESEKFIKDGDYKNLLVWYKEFYPELFQFKNINKRLDLYSIDHDLKLYTLFTNHPELIENVIKVIQK